MQERFPTPASVTGRRALAQVRSNSPRLGRDGSAELDEAPWGGLLPLAGIVQCWRNLLGGTQPSRSADRDARIELPLSLAANSLPVPTLSSRPLSPWVRAYESPDLPWQWG